MRSEYQSTQPRSKPDSALQRSPGSICTASVLPTGRALRECRDHVARRYEKAVHLAALRVEERDHAAERHAVFRSERGDDTDPIVDVAVAGDQQEVSRIIGGVARRIRLRERVALEHEGRRAELCAELLEGATSNLAVVDVDEHFVAVGDDEHGVVGPVLVGRDAHVRTELEHLRVRQLHHVVEAEMTHLAGEHVDAELRNEHARAAVDAPHRREVEVIEVVVREVHVVGRQPLGRRARAWAGSATRSASNTTRTATGRRGSCLRSSRCRGRSVR